MTGIKKLVKVAVLQFKKNLIMPKMEEMGHLWAQNHYIKTFF